MELDLLRLQTAMGFTAEDFDLIIEDMAALGKEPTYCMGDDIPLAVLSDKPHLLYDYFKQRFAQVTNPPIDPLREKLVMSLEMHLGERRPALKPQPEAASVIHLETPVLNEAELAAISEQGLPVKTVSTQVAVESCAGGLQQAIAALCSVAEQAVRDGAQVLVLSDRVDGTGAAAPPDPHNGGDAGLAGRGCCSSPSAAPEAAAAVLSGGGYGPVLEHPSHGLPDRLRRQCRLPLAHLGDHPPLARSPKTKKRIEQGKLPALDANQAQANVRESLENGLRKILSKIGISLLASYHGAQIFEAIGLGADGGGDRLHRNDQPCCRHDVGRAGERNALDARQGFP